MNSSRENQSKGLRSIAIFAVSLVMLLNLAVPGFAQGDRQVARELSNAFTAVAKEAMPAVVSIKVEKAVEVAGGRFGFNDPFGQFNDDLLRKFFGGRLPQQPQQPRKYQQRGQGSGFIISRDGYILTNNHVVGDVDKITVELEDGRKFENAKLIGTDPGSEVALIKIDGDNFPVLPMGDSDQMEIGDWVIAIGNPFGLSETVTVGVVSAVGRSNVHIAAYEDFIQTDAAINPGNSGGPLINLDGEVIGINTAILSESGGYMGIGFAIPINMAKTIEAQLKAHGKVTRGYLGLYGQDVTSDMADLLGLKSSGGVVIASIEKGSPSDKAGLATGDVLMEMDGKAIDSYDAFRNQVAMLKPGTDVRFQIVRDGKQRQITVTLGERPTQVAQDGRSDTRAPWQKALGITVQNVTQDLADQFGYRIGEGVIVTGVEPGTPAGDAGVQAGDLIESVNRESVSSVDEFEEALSRAKGEKVLLLVRRGEFSRYVVVPLGR